MRYIFMLFIAMMPLVQAPGEGYNLLPTPPRQIKSLYFELFKTTEVWVRLTPVGKDGQPAPVSLIFSTTFSGKKQAKIPADINIRAQVDPLFVASKFSLKLELPPGELLDLTAPGVNFEYYPRCPSGETCAVTGVISIVPWRIFRQIVEAKSVTGEVMGREVSLQEADLIALRAFAQGLVPGGVK